jgi:hypothetical protein
VIATGSGAPYRLGVAPGQLRLAFTITAATALLAAPAALALDRAVSTPTSAVARLRDAGDLHLSTSGTPVRASIAALLQAQTDAMRTGDEAGFLAPVAPALRPEMRRRYAGLRALRVTDWREQLAGEPLQSGPGRWTAGVQLTYCVVVAGCVPAPISVSTAWAEDDGGPTLVQFGIAHEQGPRPWEISDLRVAIGNRVVVAAPPSYAGRLPATLASAEKAAAITDRYARWRPPPGRYVVFLAGRDEWGHWYGAQQPPWAAGVTVPLGPDQSEIVLNATRISQAQVATTLTHEFTHVVTLAGVRRGYGGNWLLVEGVAEYVRNVGKPVVAYPWLVSTRTYVHSGRWLGTANLREPAEASSVDAAAGRYGVAYLAVRRLAERFGEDRMLAFFASVVRDGTAAEAAAVQLFGLGWAQVATDCDDFVRQSVR